MKTLKVLLSLTMLAAVATTPLVRAADSSSATAPAEKKLTDAQKAQIEQLRKEEHKAIEAVKEDKKLKDADKTTKIKAIKDDYKTKIDAVKAGK